MSSAQPQIALLLFRRRVSDLNSISRTLWRVIFQLMNPLSCVLRQTDDIWYAVHSVSVTRCHPSTYLPRQYCTAQNAISALTLNVDTSDFLLHGTGIYLAHVTALVALSDLLDAQSKRVHSLVGDTNSIIVAHY